MDEPAALARATLAAERYWRRIEEEFGMLTATQAGSLLGATSAAAGLSLIAGKRRGRHVLGIERRQGVLYPGFQFDHACGAVLPVIADLRCIGEEHGYNEASLIQWLCAPTTYLDDGRGVRRPVDLLATDPDRVSAVAANDWGVQW
ncbi:hypothetical protein ACLM5J_06805 [Nocardioides sp. Bht2]|uniref:hypothetical protein n=1 Tax=Nocardioides sp. Bht2 TaxID=3392297 RepID=UPI0039B3D857